MHSKKNISSNSFGLRMKLTNNSKSEPYSPLKMEREDRNSTLFHLISLVMLISINFKVERHPTNHPNVHRRKHRINGKYSDENR